MGFEDLSSFVELQAAPDVVRFFGRYGREEALARLRADARQRDQRGYGLLAVIERETGRFAGRVGLRYWPDWDEVDLGWVLAPELWGRGLATEAAGAYLGWAFRTLELTHVIALIEPGNTRSVRVAERLGMAPGRREFVFDRDMVVHSVAAPQAGTGATRAGSIGSETTKLVP